MICKEPIAKLVSGDQLPYVGLFPSWLSIHGTTMHLIPVQKQTQRGIAAHPPRVLQLALKFDDIVSDAVGVACSEHDRMSYVSVSYIVGLKKFS